MTQGLTSTYQPTFMEKLLGRNYKWWYIFKFNFKSAFVYRFNYILMVLRYLLTFFIFLATFIYNGSQENIEYFVVATLVFYFFATAMNISYDMKDGVLLGRYTSWLLRPSSLFKALIFRSLGMMLVPLLIRCLIFSLIFLVMGINIFASNFLWIVICLLPLAVALSCILELLLGSSSFWIPDNKFALQLFQDGAQFLVGAIIPLSFAPIAFLQYLPWSFAVYHPMQIYLGNYDTNQTLLVFTGGIIWCAGLYFLAKLIFKLGLKRNESVGL